MDCFDKLEFLAREPIWARFSQDQLLKFFELRKQVDDVTTLAQKNDPISTRDFMVNHKRIFQEFQQLKNDGFVWTQQDEDILREGVSIFDVPFEVQHIARALLQSNTLDTEENMVKRRKLKSLAKHIRDREDYMINYTGIPNSELAPEFSKDMNLDPIAKFAPECIQTLRPWCMEQFYDLKVLKPGVLSEAWRLAGRFYLYESKNDQQAVSWIRAGQIVPEFGMRGAFRSPSGKMIVVTKPPGGKTLHSHIIETPKGLPPWFWARVYRRTCEIADSLWSEGLCYSAFSSLDIKIHWNGLVCFEGLEKISALTKPTDRTMIRHLGCLLHFMLYKLPFDGAKQVPKSLKETNTEASDFIKMSTLKDDQYCLKHPICSNAYVR